MENSLDILPAYLITSPTFCQPDMVIGTVPQVRLMIVNDCISTSRKAIFGNVPGQSIMAADYLF